LKKAGWQQVKTVATFTTQKGPPRDLILDIEKFAVKLNKGIVIRCKYVHQKEIFANGRNMQYIAKIQWFIKAKNHRMTNMRDVQTCTIGDLNVVLPVVALMNVQVIEVIREVVIGVRVHVPIGIN
jgi:hypothetical protein